MNLRLAAVVGAVAISGCSHPAPVKVTAPVEDGKQTAPVAMEAELSATSARLTLRFEASATDVQVSVWGLDGLVVKGEKVLAAEQVFKQGEAKVFDVRFTPGQGRSNLVVGVTGLFGGSKLDRVATFAIGTPTEAQLKGPGTTVTTDNGERIKVMPAETK